MAATRRTSPAVPLCFAKSIKKAVHRFQDQPLASLLVQQSSMLPPGVGQQSPLSSEHLVCAEPRVHGTPEPLSRRTSPPSFPESAQIVVACWCPESHTLHIGASNVHPACDLGDKAFDKILAVQDLDARGKLRLFCELEGLTVMSLNKDQQVAHCFRTGPSIAVQIAGCSLSRPGATMSVQIPVQAASNEVATGLTEIARRLTSKVFTQVLQRASCFAGQDCFASSWQPSPHAKHGVHHIKQNTPPHEVPRAILKTLKAFTSMDTNIDIWPSSMPTIESLAPRRLQPQ